MENMQDSFVDEGVVVVIPPKRDYNGIEEENRDNRKYQTEKITSGTIIDESLNRSSTCSDDNNRYCNALDIDGTAGMKASIDSSLTSATDTTSSGSTVRSLFDRSNSDSSNISHILMDETCDDNNNNNNKELMNRSTKNNNIERNISMDGSPVYMITEVSAVETSVKKVDDDSGISSSESNNDEANNNSNRLEDLDNTMTNTATIDDNTRLDNKNQVQVESQTVLSLDSSSDPNLTGTALTTTTTTTTACCPTPVVLPQQQQPGVYQRRNDGPDYKNQFGSNPTAGSTGAYVVHSATNHNGSATTGTATTSSSYANQVQNKLHDIMTKANSDNHRNVDTSITNTSTNEKNPVSPSNSSVEEYNVIDEITVELLPNRTIIEGATTGSIDDPHRYHVGSLVQAYVVNDNDNPSVEEAIRTLRQEKDREVAEAWLDQASLKRRKGQLQLVTILLVLIIIVLGAVGAYLLNNKPPRTAFESTDDLYIAVDIYMFRKNASAIKQYGKNISEWDVSKLSNFSRVFDPNREFALVDVNNANTSMTFNHDISKWDTSRATTMYGMFSAAWMFNKDISKWNVEKVQDMSCMFSGGAQFNITSLNKWNTRSLKNSSYMFYRAEAFDGNVSDWDTSNVVEMKAMFRMAKHFGKGGKKVLNWNTSSVRSMKNMFKDAISFDSSSLGNWDVSNVEDMSEMFHNATSFSSSDLSQWNVTKVRNMTQMFTNASSFDQNISTWNIGIQLDYMDEMFYGAHNFSQNLCPWGTQLLNTNRFNVSMKHIFHKTKCLITTDPIFLINNWCYECAT